MERVLLVGASGGVGQAVARRLVARGYEVWGSVLDEPDMERMRRDVPAVKQLFIANFSNGDQGRDQLARALTRSVTPLAALISCAGVNPYGPLETMPLADLRLAFEVNALANLAAYQVALPYLRRSTGRIVFLSSYSGKIGAPLLGHYTASKHALEGLADVMRLEAGQWGIPVSLIQPGAITTPMLSSFHHGLETRLQLMPDEERRHYGAYFKQYQAFFASAGDTFITADVVADKVLEVLQADDPQPRYAIGNAVALLAQRAQLSDQQMDAMWRGILPGGAGPASGPA